MSVFFSENKNGVLERWFLNIDFHSGDQPLPNAIDFGMPSILINYALYNQDEAISNFQVKVNLEDISTLQKNSIMFDSQGGLPWPVSGQSTSPLEFPITQKEFDEAYAIAIWADPFGSAAFFGEGYWKGVLIVNENKQIQN